MNHRIIGGWLAALFENIDTASVDVDPFADSPMGRKRHLTASRLSSETTFSDTTDSARLRSPQ